MTDIEFEEFVRTVDPQLRRALSGHLPREAVADAIAEAFAHAWQHWRRVRTMDNPAGYLFRVAQSKSRQRREGFLPWDDDDGLPDFEPALLPALQALTPTQSRAVWLVHGCGWSYGEVAEALGIGVSTVGTHVSRALDHLRERIGVPDDA
jgi:DNA-directed RNA polymerase specialized sigma24 family protein